jgi:Alkylmercury lyase
VVTSSGPLTGTPVTVTFSGAKGAVEPARRGGLRRPADCGGPSGQVSCGYLNFFASPASAGQWASQPPGVSGSVLDQAAAQALGCGHIRVAARQRRLTAAEGPAILWSRPIA